MAFVSICIILSSLLALNTAEIIKLENKTHILCIAEDTDTTIYIEPPVVQHSRDNSILIENALWDDWVLKNSKDVIVPMVTDKRWENFETVYTNGIHFPSVISLGFSTTANSTHTIVSDPAVTKKQSKSESFYWIHFSTHIISDMNDFRPFQINVTSPKNYYWKIHDYNLRWANGSSETATVVPISPDDASCVVLYTYLCSYCTLDIRVDGNIYMLQGSLINEWTSRRFSLTRAASMTISRSTTLTNTTEGQWAIDIRKCPSTKSNKTILEISLENDVEPEANRTCFSVRSAKSTVVQARINRDIFSCDSGLLGRACDISCEELLNANLSYCQGHQICDDTSNSECLCAWGYQGSACDEECGDGNWGLSCQKTCNNNCNLCNGQTGECISSAPGLKQGIGLLICCIIWAMLISFR